MVTEKSRNLLEWASHESKEVESIHPVQMNLYHSNTQRKNLDYLHFEVEPRVQEKQQIQDQQGFVVWKKSGVWYFALLKTVIHCLGVWFITRLELFTCVMKCDVFNKELLVLITSVMFVVDVFSNSKFVSLNIVISFNYCATLLLLFLQEIFYYFLYNYLHSFA